MMAGAVALAVYSVVVCHLLVRARMRALPSHATVARGLADHGLRPAGPRREDRHEDANPRLALGAGRAAGMNI